MPREIDMAAAFAATGGRMALHRCVKCTKWIRWVLPYCWDCSPRRIWLHR